MTKKPIENPRLEFDVAKAALEKWGVEYITEYEYRGPVGPERKPHELPIFKSVKIPFSPEEWMEIATREGRNYIGGCCGSSSAMQDSICYWFREGGWVEIRDLEDFAARQIEHDGEEDSPFYSVTDLLGKIEKGELLGARRDPWVVLAALWHLTKGSYEPEKPAAAGDHLSPVEKTLRIVERACRALSWGRLFSEKDENGNPKGPTDQEKIARALLLARFLPAIKTLWERTGDLYFGPVDGFAVIDVEKGPKAICDRTISGYAIFESEKLVQEVFDLWDERDAEYQDRKRGLPSRERYRVRPVRVTLEEGIVFTDTGETYEGKNQ